MPVLLLLLLQTDSNANLIKNTSETEYTKQRIDQSSEISKKDSIPEAVTNDWIKNLTDENGNKIVQNNSINSIPEDPESDAFQNRIFNGLSTGSGYGISVSSAGDVNGDGYDDIIVGAFVYSSATGRAYIYYGGLNMNTIADVVLTGEATNNYFGNSVSSAGDVNGDGYSDVIIGAYGNNNNRGRAYIYFGSSNMDNTADVILTGGATSDLFGVSVSSAGDVNGDGYADVIAGASGYSTGTGRAYVYYGGSAMNNVVDVTMTGAAASNFFGYSVSSAGDVNGDGYADVISGAYGYSSNTGRAYIYLGGSVMNNVADITLTGETVNSNFGNSVSSARDVNGDGFADVIAGAYGHNSGNGRAYIYFGGPVLNNTADVILTGEAGGGNFGASVSTAGDLNGDGFTDVIAGAYSINTFTGKAYIFFGGSTMNNVVDAAFSGESAGNSFGRSVSSTGDVNGDGYSEVLIGANGFNANTGRVYFYDYVMGGQIISETAFSGETTNNNFGQVSDAGDVNGDGYSDVIVGAWGYNSNTGRAYIFFGGIIMDNIPDVIMTGESAASAFGSSVSTAGDVNGDGFSDVIVGAYFHNSFTGRAYIFFGGSSMNNIADVILTGQAASNSFGVSVSSAGDVNGDGFSDVIAGASGYNSSTGRVYIYYGGASMNNIADVIMTGASAGIEFGNSVSCAGDVNVDGYSDVIAGAVDYNSNTGRVYLFTGSVSMDNNADVIFTGEGVDDQFGFSVSDAGDVNGDGYSDIIIGARGYQSTTGRAYVFFGNSLMDNNPDVIITGDIVNSALGFSVSTAGDINSDGYSDILVGSDIYFLHKGSAYIFFGGAAMNNVPDIATSGENTNDFFGGSVSCAGDINGDGIQDVIAGASGFNSNTGKAYIFKGSQISVKPILKYVKDVPNDQGGKVNISWVRSGYDVNGNNIITNYIVERSYPPSGGNYSWEEIANITANKNPFYNYTADTPLDSSSNSNGNLFFRITARTQVSSQFWRSAILSGRSIDNIAPHMVSPFTATAVSNNVSLNWKHSSAPDLLNYILYRNVNPTIDPETEPVFATTNDSTFLDTSPLNGKYYYFIVAQDIHNNKSPVAAVERPGMILNLVMFIEGFYNSGSNLQTSDTISVELRNATSPYAVTDFTKTILYPNGSATVKFSNAVSGNYYFAIKHRNSIETWSRTSFLFSIVNSLNYNLSNLITQAFGSNQIQVDASPVRFAVYSGDVNQDGLVDLTDMSLIFNDALIFATGYLNTDLNGDGLVDVGDAVIADNNSFNFISKITP